MNLPVTLALLGFGAALVVLFGWLGARPKRLDRPRMAPWQFLMLLAAAWSLMMIVHLLNLLGAHTGNQQQF